MVTKNKIISFFKNCEITENSILNKPERRKLVRQFNNILYKGQVFLHERNYFYDIFNSIEKEKIELFFKATKVRNEKYNGFYRMFYLRWKDWLNSKREVLSLSSKKFSKKICSIIRDYRETCESELLDKLISGNFSNKQLLEMYYSVHYYAGDIENRDKVNIILGILRNRLLNGEGERIFTTERHKDSPVRKFPMGKRKDFIDYAWKIKLEEKDLSEADEIEFKIYGHSEKVSFIQNTKYGSGNQFYVISNETKSPLPLVQARFKGFLSFYINLADFSKANISITTYKKRKILFNKKIFFKNIELNFGKRLKDLENREYTILWNRDGGIIYFAPKVKGGSNYAIIMLSDIGLELRDGVTDEMLKEFLDKININ